VRLGLVRLGELLGITFYFLNSILCRGSISLDKCVRIFLGISNES
jgi:hypothetical protein